MKVKCIFDEETECPVIPFLLQYTQSVEHETPRDNSIPAALAKISRDFISSARITILPNFCNVCLLHRIIKKIEKVLTE